MRVREVTVLALNGAVAVDERRENLFEGALHVLVGQRAIGRLIRQGVSQAFAAGWNVFAVIYVKQAHSGKQLAAAGVELLSAGLDENPGVYKDIHQVMAAQTDLVDVLGKFEPKLVKMAPAGEKAED